MISVLVGRQGCGKTTRMLEAALSMPGGAMIVTPQNDTYEAERRLMASLGGKATFDYSVTSLTRLAQTLAGNAGVAERACSRIGQAILVKDVLAKKAPSLTVLSGAARSQGFAGEVLGLIRELRSSRLTASDVRLLAGDVPSPASRARLEEIAGIVEEYSARLNAELLDEDDLMLLAAQACEKPKGAFTGNICFDGFDVFTRTEMILVESLVRGCASATFTLAYDETDPAYITGPTMDFITGLGPTAVTRLTRRRVSDSALEALSLSITRPGQPPFIQPQTSVITRACRTPQDEAAECAAFAAKLVRGGMRYGQIEIMCDLEEYAETVTSALEAAGVPHYLNAKRPITHTAPVRALLHLLDTCRGPLTWEVITEYARTGFARCSRQDTDVMENYFREFAPSPAEIASGNLRANSSRRPHDLQTAGLALEAVMKDVRLIRDRLSGALTSRNFAEGLYSFMEDSGFQDRILAFRDSFAGQGEYADANVYAQIHNQLIEMITQFHRLPEFGLDAGEFYDLVRFALMNADVGLIPAVTDQVRVNPASGGSHGEVEALIVMGAASGSFPAPPSPSILGEDACEAAFARGLPLNLGDEAGRRRAFFNLCKTLTRPHEVLMITWPAFSAEGAESAPSVIAGRVASLFPGSDPGAPPAEELLAGPAAAARRVIEERSRFAGAYPLLSSALSRDARTARQIQAAQMKTLFTEPKAIRDAKSWDEALGKPFVSSVSMLERYAECPYSFFLEYMLRPSQSPRAQFTAADLGNALHGVIDEFCSGILSGRHALEELDREKVDGIVSGICAGLCESYNDSVLSRISSSPFVRIKLERFTADAAWEITRQLQGSPFSLSGTEARFERGARLGAVKLDVAEGDVELQGKVDRIDVLASPEGSYIRIIDYKSSSARFVMDEMLAGVNLQLPVYLQALMSSTGCKPAGFFYEKLKEEPVRVEKETGLHSISDKLSLQYRLKGVASTDPAVTEALRLEGASAKGVAMSGEELADLCEKARATASELAGRIITGHIPASPLRVSGALSCSRCSVRAACDFSARRNPQALRSLAPVIAGEEESYG